MINLSIHPQHFTPHRSSSVARSEQPAINEVNSVYELIAEGIFETDVPESEEEDIDSSSPPLELYLSNSTCGQLPPFNFFVEHFS
ncbi:MAG TPA: hypothetical protein VFL47_01655, partial [Flavisolibacter sp.]|nr:hypothetical protein [Flavisolibacter sp.]